MSEVPPMSAAQLARAETMLRSVMAQAEEEAGKLNIELDSSSPLGKQIVQYCSRDNLFGLHIHHRLPWGWYADLLLQDMPLGTANVIGTPSRSPLASREEAEKAGVDLVAFVLAAERYRKEASDDGAYLFFGYCGHYLQVPQAAVAMAAASAASMEYAETDAQRVKRLDEVTAELFGEADVTTEALDALSIDAQVKLMACIICALALGIIRYPEIVPDVKDWKR